MSLQIRIRQKSSVPIEVEGIVPAFVRGKSLAEVEKLSIFNGNRKESLAEFFDITGDTLGSEIIWEGDLAGVHWIGAKMTEGIVRVVGSAGRHLGSEMTGGEIHVDGDAGDWVGGELHGGLIQVRGRAGHLVGAAYRGSARGMTGGTILIHGDVGNELGHTLRRGLIAVGGDTGDLIGFNMLAGTILIVGESGIRHGAGMRRGTIGFFGLKTSALLPTFRRACRLRPIAMDLLVRELMRYGFPLPDDALTTTFDLYNGDLLEGGRGEILIRAM